MPLGPFVTLSAGHEGDEAWEAMDVISVRSVVVIRTVDLEEFNLVAVFGLELVNDLVPLWHEFDTPSAGRHEEVDDDELVRAIELVNLVLEVFFTTGHVTMGLLVPLKIHFYEVFGAIRIVIV